MTEARTYQCPVCGGFAREGERACRSCHSALATLRCQHCFELNFPDSLHCRGCGSELDVNSASEVGTRSCPDCSSPLTHVSNPSGTLDACERCGLQFVSHALLRDLLAQTAVLAQAALSLGAAAPRRVPVAQAVQYRPCPVCHALMNRKNFGGASGIIVDVCSLHGSLFDPGELPGVLDFARRGGLARAELREKERALVNRNLGPHAGSELSKLGPTPLVDFTDLSAAADWVLELSRFIAQLLRRS